MTATNSSYNIIPTTHSHRGRSSFGYGSDTDVKRFVLHYKRIPLNHFFPSSFSILFAKKPKAAT